MSIKTVALDIGVYQKLARIKGERESFSKAIERLVDRHLTAHTGSDIASALASAPAPLSAHPRQTCGSQPGHSRHSAALVRGNLRHFEPVEDLRLVPY